MNIRELHKVPKNKIGRINYNGIGLESHEYDTILLLALYGFDIELITPSNTLGNANPDILMLGTSWEIKSPETSNLKTIKKRIHKASTQAARIIFDLRRVKHGRDSVKKDVLKRFVKNPDLRRIIIIETNEKVIDIRR